MANTTSITLSTTKMNGYISTNGQTSLNISLLTVSSVNVGMKFTLGNIFDVHPETKQQYPQLKQFTVVGVTDVSTFTFSPAVFRTGPRQNVTGVGTTTSTQALTWVGSPNSSYVLGLMYHKDAFTFATAALPLMAASEKCVRRTQDGLSLRVWQDSDIRNDELLTRIDILYGFAAIRPEWACAVVGSSV
jgi:P22 coat protein - gene protein 5